RATCEARLHSRIRGDNNELVSSSAAFSSRRYRSENSTDPFPSRSIMYTALLAMFHLCGAQVGTDLHQGKLQIGKSGSAVVPAFVTELCFRAGGCEEITTPPEVGISRIFCFSRFQCRRHWLEGRALAKTRTGCLQASENPPFPALQHAQDVRAALTSTPDPANAIHNTRQELVAKNVGASNPHCGWELNIMNFYRHQRAGFCAFVIMS